MNRHNEKKALGEVISTIFLILVVSFSVVMLASFVIPLIKDTLKEGKCVNYNGKIYITNTKYTCYDDVNKKMRLQIKFDGSLDEKDLKAILGLKIVIRNDSTTGMFDIIPGSSSPEIEMYDGSIISLPKMNEEKTYTVSVNDKPKEVIVYPMLKDNQKCASAFYNLNFIKSC